MFTFQVRARFVPKEVGVKQPPPIIFWGRLGSVQFRLGSYGEVVVRRSGWSKPFGTLVFNYLVSLITISFYSVTFLYAFHHFHKYTTGFCPWSSSLFIFIQMDFSRTMVLVCDIRCQHLIADLTDFTSGNAHDVRNPINHGVLWNIWCTNCRPVHARASRANDRATLFSLAGKEFMPFNFE